MSGITNPAERYFKDGLWTYDGTVWRPQGQLYAYRDVVRDYTYNVDAGAGNNTLTLSTVPAGEVWVVESLLAINTVTAASIVNVYVNSGGTTYLIQFTNYDTVTRMARLLGQITLKATEYITCVFGSCVLHDALYAYCVGHKFKVAE